MRDAVFALTFCLVVPFAAHLLACLTPAQTSAIVGGGQALEQCVENDVTKGADNFETIAQDCGGAAIAEVVGIVETLAAKASPVQTLAQAVRHKAQKAAQP
jgi:hypothetical protein